MMFFLLTVLMGVLDFIPSAAYAIQSLMSRGVVKVFGANVAKRSFLDWIYILVWVSAGVLSLYVKRPPSVLTLFIFLTFKGGADLGARAIYMVHDASLLRHKGLSKVIATSIVLATLPSIIFFISWGIFQQLFTSLSATILGISMNSFPYYLWAAGISFGIIFGVIRSIGEGGILLRGELFLVMGSKIIR